MGLLASNIDGGETEKQASRSPFEGNQ